DLGVLSVCAADDAARLVSVKNQIAVAALQAKTDALGDVERQWRSEQEGPTEELSDRVNRKVKVRGQAGAGAAGSDGHVKPARHRSQCRANWGVAWPVEDVVLARVFCHPSF